MLAIYYYWFYMGAAAPLQAKLPEFYYESFGRNTDMKKKMRIVLCCVLSAALLFGVQATAFSLPTSGNENGFEWVWLTGETAAITGYTGSDTVVTIPATVESGMFDVVQIGNDSESGVFTGKNFTSVTLPAGVTRLCGRSFKNCASLQSVTLPSTLSSIDYEAFVGCSSLTSVTLPANLTQIGEGAFRQSGLTGISLPASVNYIGPEAFAGCASLAKATIFADTLTFDEDTDFPTYDKKIFSHSPMTGGIYGYNGSDAQSYAASHSIKFFLISSDDTFSDPTTGVEVSGSLPDGSALQAELVSEGSGTYTQAQQSLGATQVLVLYDLSLMIGTDAVQPNGNVTVTLPIPEEYQGLPNLVVAYIDGSGHVTYINGTVSGGEITFVTSHFSSYALVQKASSGSVKLTAGTTTLYVGGRTTITPSIKGGVWQYDNALLDLTKNADGSVTVKGLKSGTAKVHYTVGWAAGDVTLTIGARSMPQTGQDFLPVYILALLAAGAAGVVLLLHKKKVKN